jgi:hypothetical protein
MASTAALRLGYRVRQTQEPTQPEGGGASGLPDRAPLTSGENLSRLGPVLFWRGQIQLSRFVKVRVIDYPR